MLGVGSIWIRCLGGNIWTAYSWLKPSKPDLWVVQAFTVKFLRIFRDTSRVSHMSEMTLFEKIIAREIPAEILYEDDLCLCFRDIAPQAPVHLLVVPKKPIVRVAEAAAEDKEVLGHLLLTAQLVAKQEGFVDDGFRVVINNGADGGEAVPHLHVHILAGRKMTWPPG